MTGGVGNGVGARRATGGELAADVVVVGGGVAGLACAAALGEAGLRVIILEARDRLGGRIHTLHPHGSPLPVELGAEFVHGNPPELLELLARANATLTPALAQPWIAGTDGLRPSAWGEGGSDELMTEIEGGYRPDRVVDEVLTGWLAGHPAAAADVDQLREFVAGFHAGDPAVMGANALAHETRVEREEQGDSQSMRVGEGYDLVVAALRGQLGATVTTLLGTAVRRIRWRSGEVTVSAGPSGAATSHEPGLAASAEVVARRAVITLPVGVLRAGTVTMDGMPASHAAALERLHMGHARRIVLCFDEAFWLREAVVAPGVRAPLAGMGFLRAPLERVSVWWGYAAPMLTGWMGGPRAQAVAGWDDNRVTDLAVKSLAGALRLEPGRIRRSLLAAYTHDWSSDPWALGAYSYAGVDGMEARRVLASPVASTLYWAGEATNWEGSAGTVHAALATGRRAARELLRTDGAE